MFGFHKQGRSKFGRFLDKQGINQTTLMELSGLSRGTISNLCNSESAPRMDTFKKIKKALKKLDINVNTDTFWCE